MYAPSFVLRLNSALRTRRHSIMDGSTASRMGVSPNRPASGRQAFFLQRRRLACILVFCWTQWTQWTQWTGGRVDGVDGWTGGRGGRGGRPPRDVAVVNAGDAAGVPEIVRISWPTPKVSNVSSRMVSSEISSVLRSSPAGTKENGMNPAPELSPGRDERKHGLAPSTNSVPAGTADNSPPLQWWEARIPQTTSPAGTADNRTAENQNRCAGCVPPAAGLQTSIPSMHSSSRFQASPAPKPPRPFRARMRWQGTTSGTGLRPTAWPTARAARTP